MKYLVDTNKKIIFGWSAKCGCSHLKTIFHFLVRNRIYTNVHINDSHKLPEDIENYTTIIVSRNPFYRIVSGFLDKYRQGSNIRLLWNHETITFSQFVNEIINDNWKITDQHHFIHQTKENFNKKILLSKTFKLYDISNIDYNYIEQLYNKKIPKNVLSIKGKQIRKNFELKTNDNYYNTYVFDLNIDEYINYKIDYKYFYNEEIKEKVFNYFIDDFIFFYENGIDYIHSEI